MKDENSNTMTITLNGNQTDIDESSTISGLLEKLGVEADSVVVELNTEIIKPDVYTSSQLGDGDVVEIIRFVGGG